MINNVDIIGDEATTFHDFAITQNGMILEVSPGSYTRKNSVLFSDASGANITIPTPVEDTYFEIDLTTDGIAVASKTASQILGDVPNFIDRLAWFDVPAGTTSLDNVEINVMRTVIA